MLTRPESPLGELLNDLTRQLGTLLRAELILARAEMSAKFVELRRDLSVMAVSAMLALAGFIVLLGAITAGIVAAGWPPWAAALLVAVVTLILAGALLTAAARRLNSVSLAPEETLQTLKEDTAWAMSQTGRP